MSTLHKDTNVFNPYRVHHSGNASLQYLTNKHCILRRKITTYKEIVNGILIFTLPNMFDRILPPSLTPRYSVLQISRDFDQ